MLFQLPSFLLFFVVFATLLHLVPSGLRGAYVTAASLFFYAWWYPPFIFMLIGLILFCWAAGRQVDRNPAWLAPLVVAALLPLAVFKYTDFALGIVGQATGFPVPHLGWPLPLGISFVTFTLISVLVDITRRRDLRAPSLRETALFISFFPHLIAGPILRPNQFFPQMSNIRFDWKAFTPNLALFAVGIVKKVLIADPVGRFVDMHFAASATTTSLEATLAAIGFSIQIYCDFSAYTDMALGLAGMMGVSLPENFRSPYLSTSMTELWQRWHMTLSFWLRDYVFKPLHPRLQAHGRYLSIIATMTISGLWHGAAWTFVLWGLAHGLIIALEGATGHAQRARMAQGAKRWVVVTAAFAVWTSTAILFRAGEIDTALDIYAGIAGLRGWGTWPEGGTLVLAMSALMFVTHAADQAPRIRAGVMRLPPAISIPLLLTIVVTCSFVAAGRPESFYYFDF